MAPIQIRRGGITMQFDPEVGMLRYLKSGETEVVRGIYAAVRNENWGTYPHRVHDVRQEETADGFRLTWRDVSGPMVWEGTLSLAGNEVVYSVRGVAQEDFATQRTGVCVLHPAAIGGAACRIEHTDGRVEEAEFPKLISPDQPFFDVRAIEHEFAPGQWARVVMEGEVFETEDQRNWMDASFKTYCRPHDWPRPYPVARGEEIVHTVTVRVPELTETPPPSPKIESAKPQNLKVEVGAVLEGDETPDLLENAGALDYVAFLLDASAPEAETRLRWANGVAETLGLPLEIHVRGGGADDLVSLDNEAIVARYFIPDAAVRHALQGTPIQGRIWTATTGNFTELNCERPDRAHFDGVGFTVNAQVHAFDDQSIRETPEGLGHVVATAKAIYPGLPVRLSPALFGPSDDPRLGDALHARWTEDMIAAARDAGAAGITPFTLRHWRSPSFDALRASRRRAKEDGNLR